MMDRLLWIVGAITLVGALAASAGCDSGQILLSNDGGDEPTTDGGDVGDDGPEAEDGSSDSGLAPPCSERPAFCLRAENPSTFEINRLLYSAPSPGSPGGAIWPDYVLHGLSASGPGGPALLNVLPVPSDEPGGAIDIPLARSFDAAGHPVADPAAFEEMELHFPYMGWSLRGDILRLADGSTLAVWRVPVVDEPGPGVILLQGFRTEAYRVEDGETRPAGIFHATGLAEEDQVFPDATAVEFAGRTWVVSSGPDGVLLSPLDEPERVVLLPTDPPPSYELRVAPLDGDRIVVAWTDPTTVVGTSANALIAGPEGIEVGPTTVFPLALDLLTDIHLAVTRDGIYVARYDRDEASVRSSRIRVARLDESLDRVEPDRWIDGWGGVEPAGLALVVMQDRPWLVFQTRDARYGSYPVLYAQPLALPACGYSVDAPAAVLQPHRLIERGLVASGGDTEIWAVVAYVRDNATADLFHLIPCD